MKIGEYGIVGKGKREKFKRFSRDRKRNLEQDLVPAVTDDIPLYGLVVSKSGNNKAKKKY